MLIGDYNNFCKQLYTILYQKKENFNSIHNILIILKCVHTCKYSLNGQYKVRVQGYWDYPWICVNPWNILGFC
jgi:hypothetical protein